MKINLIKEDNLRVVIKFLAKGFSLSNDRSNQIEKFLKTKINKNKSSEAA